MTWWQICLAGYAVASVAGSLLFWGACAVGARADELDAEFMREARRRHE
jgi:hypothetical protein